MLFPKQKLYNKKILKDYNSKISQKNYKIKNNNPRYKRA